MEFIVKPLDDQKRGAHSENTRLSAILNQRLYALQQRLVDCLRVLRERDLSRGVLSSDAGRPRPFVSS